MAVAAAPAWADMSPLRVSIDMSGISGNMELEVDLFDLSGTIGDTHVLLDNVRLFNGGTIASANFEDGTLQGFDASLNPGSVHVVSGNLDGTGSNLLRIDEDPIVTPTITWRDFVNPGATTLNFDFLFESTGTPGPLGPDELVVSLLNPDTLSPLVPGLNGLGDVVRYNAVGGVRMANGVTGAEISPVPAPGAAMLGATGLVCLAASRRKKLRRQS
jgi:hypothetical protein